MKDKYQNDVIIQTSGRTLVSYVSLFGDVLMFFAPRTYENKKRYIRGFER